MEFAKFVSEERQKKFKSARQFFEQAGIDCSYFYYKKVENGHVPEIKIAMAILKALNANTRKGLYAWVRDHMPDSQSKAMFVEIGGDQHRSAKQTSPDQSLVINRMQKKLIESDPVYWEIVTYVSTYNSFFMPDEKKIAAVLKLPIAEARRYLQELYDHGMIEKNAKGEYFTKEWIFIPYEEEFVSTRDFNFKNAVKKFLKANDKKKFRTTITRLLTDEQRAELESLVIAFTNSVADIKTIDDFKDADPCTVGVFCSRRDFSNA